METLGNTWVDFTTPDDLELFGSQISGSKYFDDMMKEMESTYQDAFDDYIWKSYYEQIRKLLEIIILEYHIPYPLSRKRVIEWLNVR